MSATNIPRFRGSELRSGSAVAAQSLVAAGNRLAFSAALGVLGDEMAAEETTADALRLVLEQRDAAPNDPEACVRWWVTATRQLAIDRARGRLLDVRTIRAFAANEARIRYGLDDVALREFLEELPPVQRQALALVFAAGLTLDEAARRLGMPASDVAVQIGDLYRQLGEALADAVTPAS
jgi:DNA-directed RNA polymerase specialized sigma24 family protein